MMLRRDIFIDCRMDAIFKDGRQVNDLAATGTSKSINDWASKANLDLDQKRVFQILCASFILTFLDDVRSESLELSRHQTLVFNKEQIN